MRIIGMLILALEIASLVLTLQQECKQNNINFRTIKNKLASIRYKIFRKWRPNRSSNNKLRSKK